MDDPTRADLIEAIHAQTREIRALRSDLDDVRKSPLIDRPVATIGRSIFWFALLLIVVLGVFAGLLQ